ncbi:unnamed protein product, partial [Symbiodinium pilosum]
YQRSRGAELCSNALVPPKFSDVEVKSKYRARELLDRALQARIDRKQEEANCQRRQRQRILLEQLCNRCFAQEPAQDPAPGAAFWKRHSYCARARCHDVADGHMSSSVNKSQAQTARLHRELARRAPAHADDSIRAVLSGQRMPRTPPACKPSSGPGIQSDHFQVSYDRREPYVMAYNTASAGFDRKQKWSLQEGLAGSFRVPKVRAIYGHDETELDMVNAAQAMEQVAGGGRGIANKILGLRARGAAWDRIGPFAKAAQAAAFEMPKELALEVALCLAEAAGEATGSMVHKEVEPVPLMDEISDAAEAAGHLCAAAMSLLASAAARARDADGVDFPLRGLEVIAETGLGWAAFSNMFLVAMFAQLQRCNQAQLEISEEAAARLSEVLVWASDCYDIASKLAPAGRRVVRAAQRTLRAMTAHGPCDAGMLAKLALLDSLAVRPA